MPGFCRSVNVGEIKEHGFVLTPGRYVGAEEVEDETEVFVEKMERLTAELTEQMAKSAAFDAAILQKLRSMGYAE